MDSGLEKYVDMAIQLAMGYGPKLVLAILTLIIGLWIINSVSKRVS
jgi:small conductance mechanosensitive channel|tara:strand:- start:408 stop:545 length:138 start_codon:yes stop_codon:yes gene_type:complete